VVVGVEFDVEIKRLNSLEQKEWQSLIATTLTAMRAAYIGYAVEFNQAVAGKDYPRRIWVRNTLGPGVGATNKLLTFSEIHIPNLEMTMESLPELGCQTLSFTECVNKTGRSRFFTALFEGAGNTGAHELGHQRGLFLDRHAVNCLDCYDNDTVVGSYAHFFGTLHWSEYAKTRMRDWLPPAGQR
jgi:hypothetical protein